jgi:hypothetical protein
MTHAQNHVSASAGRAAAAQPLRILHCVTKQAHCLKLCLCVQSGRGAAPPAERAALERDWEFTAASQGQVLGTVALGIANIVAVVALSAALTDPYNKVRWLLHVHGPDSCQPHECLLCSSKSCMLCVQRRVYRLCVVACAVLCR